MNTFLRILFILLLLLALLTTILRMDKNITIILLWFSLLVRINTQQPPIN